MSIKGTIQIPRLGTKPSAPPVGSVILYIKTDNIIYVQDSTGTEYPFASASLITDLHGDVDAHGPGDAVATVLFVGGKSAAEVAASVNATQAATSANTFSTIVKRDSAGNIFITQINGVVPEAHAARHLPSGADALATAAPSTDLNANSSNSVGAANSLARSDHSHALDTGTPVTETPDQSNSAGTSANLARADHVHTIATAAPAADLTAATTNARGNASSFARSDHSHAIDTGTPSTQTPDQANAVGTSPNLARADHIHAIATAVAVDVATANAQGASTSFSRADHAHKGVRSVKANAGTQRFGDVSLQSGVGATVVDDGAGNFTIDVTGGSSELMVSYPGSGLSVNFTAGKVIFNGTETFVAAGSVVVPASTTNGYVYVDIDAVVKSAASLPANAVPLAIFNTGLSSVTFLEDARVFLSKNQVWGLTGDVQGLSATAAASGGSSEKTARVDHVHAIPTAAPSANLDSTTTNATGSSASLSRADHAHAITTAAPVAQTPDQANAAGSAAGLAKADHVHNIATAAPVSDLTAATTNAQGVAATFSRSDHSHAVDTGTPVTQTPDQANAAGSSPNLARADHIHDIPSGTPVQIGTTNFVGAAPSFALSDHVHQLTDAVATARLLTGFAVGANTPIVAADSILGAFGKTQGQINAITGSAITALTGDVTATGPGSVPATIAVGAVTDAKASLAVKPAVTVVATTNQALTGTPTIDGQATASGSIILLTAQSTASENGPWVAAAGAWSRPTWYPNGGTTQAFQFITAFVRLGTVYQGSVWRQTAAAPITIGTTATTWVVTPTSGNYKSLYTIGPVSGSSDVQLNFSNAFTGTLAWNPTSSYQIKLPPTQGAAGTFPTNDGAGNLSWTNPVVNIDGGAANSNYTAGQIINGGSA